MTDSQSDRQKVDQIYFTVKICRTPDLHKLVFSAHRLTPVLLSLLDIFIHHRGGRNKQKKNSDNNNNNMEERSNITNLTNFQ